MLDPFTLAMLSFAGVGVIALVFVEVNRRGANALRKKIDAAKSREKQGKSVTFHPDLEVLRADLVRAGG